MHSLAITPSGTLVELQPNSVQWGLIGSGKALLKQALTQVTKNAKNTRKCSWSTPFIEDASNGDLASENASDFPEVLVDLQDQKIVLAFSAFFGLINSHSLVLPIIWKRKSNLSGAAVTSVSALLQLPADRDTHLAVCASAMHYIQGCSWG